MSKELDLPALLEAAECIPKLFVKGAQGSLIIDLNLVKLGIIF